jgi:hypothetical protein
VRSVIALAVLAACFLPSEGRCGPPRLVVTEVARSVDVARGGERFVTLTVEVRGDDPAALRRFHPRRDDFRLLAGKDELGCRWLRGGSVPEASDVLRFTLGFSPPRAGVTRVRLRARLPADLGTETRSLTLSDLRTDAGPFVRQGKGWRLTVTQVAERAYDAPELPARGVLLSKGGLMDVRVFRKERASAEPARAMTVRFESDDVGLYDPVVDLNATASAGGGPEVPLLAARLTRDPARSSPAAKERSPVVRGELFFALPPRGGPVTVVLTLHARAAGGDRVITTPEVRLP